MNDNDFVPLPDRRSSLSELFEQTRNLSPIQAAEIIRLSGRFGVPTDQVASAFDAFKNGAIDDVDWDAMERNSPRTAEFLQDPYYMATIRNRTRQLEEIEGAWKPWKKLKEESKNTTRSLLGGLTGMWESFLNSPATPANYIGNEIGQVTRLQPQSQFINPTEQPGSPIRLAQTQNQADTLRGMINSDLLKPGTPVTSDWGGNIPGLNHTWGQLGLEMVGMLPQMAGQMAAFALGGPVGSFAFNTTMIGGGQYLDLTGDKDNPVDPQRALAASLGNALTQAWMENLSLAKMFKKLPAGSSRAFRWRERAESTMTEALTEWIQQYPEAAAEIFAQNPGKSREEMASLFAKDFIKNTQEGLFQGLVAAPFGFLGRSVTLAVQEKAVQEFVRQREVVQDKMRKSELLGVSPEVLRDHSNQVSGDASIYIDPAAVVSLYQSDTMAPQEIEEKLGVTLNQALVAQENGELLTVPAGKYDVAAAQDPQIHEALKNDIAPDEHGITLRRVGEREEIGRQEGKQSAEALKKQREDLKVEREMITGQLRDAGVSAEVANATVNLLVRNAMVMSADPAAWLREKGPLFVRGKSEHAMLAQLNEDVDINSTVPVIKLDGLAASMNASQLTKYVQSLASQPISTADQKAIMNIVPGRENLKHIVWSSRKSQRFTPERKAALSSIKDLIENAVLIESQTNQKTDKKPGATAYHRFYVPVEVNGEIRAIRIVAEETNGSITLNPTDVNLYDVLVEKNIRSLLPASQAASHKTGDDIGQKEKASTITIRQMLDGVNDMDGQPYISDTYEPGNLLQAELGYNSRIKRGGFSWHEQRPVITLFERANTSTIIHEMAGHYFIYNLLGEGGKADAAEWMKADRRTMLEWAGVSEDQWNDLWAKANEGTKDEWNMSDAELAESGDRSEIRQAVRQVREAHEKMARAAEVYFMTGEAPTVDTRSIFRKFKDWLTKVYFDVTRLGVEVPPEVRKVFDRMVATQDEIEQTEALNGYHAKLPESIYDSLSEKARDALDRTMQNVAKVAHERLSGRVLADLRADVKKDMAAMFDKVRQDVEAERADNNAHRLLSEIELPLTADEQAMLDLAKAEGAAPQNLLAALNQALMSEIKRSRSTDNRLAVQALEQAVRATHYAMEKTKTIAWNTQENTDMAKAAEVAVARFMENDRVRPAEVLAPDQVFDRMGPEFEIMAEAAGFDSAAMAKEKIRELPPITDEISFRVTGLVADKYNLLRDRDAIHQAAEESLFNEDGLLQLAMEQQIMEEKLTSVMTREAAREKTLQNREIARRQAKDMLAKKPLDESMRTRTYMAAVTRAAEKASWYLAKGDIEAALEQKKLQTLNHALVQESIRIREEFDKTDRYFKRQRVSDRKTWGTEEHWQQAADLLYRLGYRRADFTGKVTEALASYIGRMSEENPDMLAIEDWLSVTRDIITPRKLTLDRLLDVANAIRNIKRMAQYGAGGDRMFTQEAGLVEVTNNLVDTAEENAKDVQIDQMGERVKPSVYATFMAGLRKPSLLFRKLDPGDFGPWSKAMYYAFAAARDVESQLLRRVSTKVEEAFQRAGLTKEDRYRDAHEKIYVAEWGTSVTRNMLRAVLLNMGSKSNLERMLSSEPVGYRSQTPWTLDNITPVLEKYLAPRDFQLAQDIWDAINLYDEYSAMVKKVTGFPMQKVDPTPVTFQVGGLTIPLRGGYYPLKQDSRASKQAEMNEAKMLAGGGAGDYPYPHTGASKSRVAGAMYPLDYDLGNLMGSVSRTVHDIAFRPVALDINKLMRQDSIKDVMRRKLGDANYQVITKWQETVMRGQNSDVDRGLNDGLAQSVRQRVVISNLLLRVSTVFQNAANFTLYGGAVEGFGERDAFSSFIKYGVFEYIPMALSGQNGAAEIRQFVYEKSTLMRDKMDSPDYSLTELLSPQENLLNKSLMDNGLTRSAGNKLTATQDRIVKFGSQILAFSDQLTDISMWRGAYFKAMNEGKTEAEAVRFADTVIERSTGTGRTIDTAAIQRGSAFEKLFSMFYSFLNTQYNRWAMERDIYLKEKDVVRLMSFVATKYLMFGMISALASFKVPDDDERWGEWLVKEVLEWPLSMVPIVGAPTKMMLDRAFGFRTWGYDATPAERNLEKMTALIGKAAKVANGDKEVGDLVEPAMESASFIFGYPDQINDWFMNAYDVLSGNMAPRLTDLVRRRPKKER